MATITTTVKVWVKDDTREVFTEAEIAQIKADIINGYNADRDELYDAFDAWCGYANVYPADLFFANEETRADYLRRFNEYLGECADEDIEDEFSEQTISVDIEVNA